MYENTPTEVPKVSMVVQVATATTSVPANIFTGTLEVILGFTNIQVWVLVNEGYASQESVLYWKFIDIKYWCQLKSKIYAILSGISYGDKKIKFPVGDGFDTAG